MLTVQSQLDNLLGSLTLMVRFRLSGCAEEGMAVSQNITVIAANRSAFEKLFVSMVLTPLFKLEVSYSCFGVHG